MKTGFIGGGKMGEAIISNLISSHTVKPQDIYVSDKESERRRIMRQRYCVNVFSDNRAIPESVDVLVLAVKPQDLDKALDTLGDSIGEKHLVLSIAAGKRLSYLKSRLPESGIVRVMPNIAALVSQSMTVFTADESIGDTDRRKVEKLLSSFGRVLELPEAQFDAVTALSGSGPAFFGYFLQAMIEGGMSLGLTEKDSAVLAKQTILGTATLLVEKSISAGELIEAVSSPGGTTVAGLGVLEEEPLKEIVRRALSVTAVRSQELSN